MDNQDYSFITNSSGDMDLPPSGNDTPLMNSIQEEDSPTSPIDNLETPYYSDVDPNKSMTNLDLLGNTLSKNQRESNFINPNKPFFASPKLSRPNSAFYSTQEGNNSSSSIIYNPSFTFGGTQNGSNSTTNAPTILNKNTTNIIHNNNNNNIVVTPTKNNNHYNGSNLSINIVTPTKKNYNTDANNNNSNHLNFTRENRRGSYKYVPDTKFAPPPSSRNKSPIRSTSPERLNNNRKSSLMLDSPFNFTTQRVGHQNTPPSSGSRASFRKGHRYKHSSVSMNFFQEPEVKIPLNIAKSLPIPNFHDLIENLPWPKAFLQLAIVSFQAILCLFTYQLGHSKNWNNFLTLSHFITYDIIGSLIIILVENLAQFEVWFTGTLTFPFGLNRIDVLLSFASAISLCFVGLDLVFHVLEETIVLFIEKSNHDNNDNNEHHEEIASQIPHSHNSSLTMGNDINIWYIIVGLNLILANLSLYKIYIANTNSKLKTKNPLVTIVYTLYLFILPSLANGLIANVTDHVATIVIAMFILMHGLTIVEWTSTILLNGFSTTTLTGFALLDPYSPSNSNDTKIKGDKFEKQNNSLIRQTSLTSLPIAMTQNHPQQLNSNNTISDLKRRNVLNDPTRIKSIIKERIESLPEFKSRCHLDSDNLIISKINYELYIVLIKLTLNGGSNDDEQKLLLAIDKCIKRSLPSSETTIEIDRL